MNTIFTSGFLSMLEALIRIFLIVILAGFLVRKKILSKNQIDGLSDVTVKVLLPALVFSNTLQYFDPKDLSYWWLLPVLGILLPFAGLLWAWFIFQPKPFEKKNLLALATMQNAGYLVLPIGQVVYPGQFKAFSLLTFLFILGYNPVLWTFGKYLVTSEPSATAQFDIRKLITPPAAANIISLLLVLLGWQHIFPETFVYSIDFLGKAAVPIATFVLGATLGGIVIKKMPDWRDILRVLSVKYLLLPLSILTVLWYFQLGKTYPLLSDFLIIQAAAAPATGLILQVRTYGGDRHKVAGIMFIAYLVCLVALPFWIALWHSMN